MKYAVTTGDPYCPSITIQSVSSLLLIGETQHLLQLLEVNIRSTVFHCHVPSLSTWNNPTLFLPLSDFLLLVVHRNITQDHTDLGNFLLLPH